MALFVIGDIHLSLGSNKPMDVFGGGWEGYVDKLREGFRDVGPEDTVVLCGDRAWGMGLAEAEADSTPVSSGPTSRKGRGSCCSRATTTTGGTPPPK